MDRTPVFGTDGGGSIPSGGKIEDFDIRATQLLVLREESKAGAMSDEHCAKSDREARPAAERSEDFESCRRFPPGAKLIGQSID